MRSIVFFIIYAVSLQAAHLKHFDFNDIHFMPTSIEKDYYIWRYLRQSDTTARDAKRIIKEVSRLNKKLKEAYRKKTGAYPHIKPKSLYYYEKLDKELRLNKTQADYAFEKALALLRRGQTKRAKGYLFQAKRLFIKREKKDKALFWLYLTTKEKHYLRTLVSSSPDINVYTLLAADILHEKYPDTIVVPKPEETEHPDIDADSPIDWARVKYRLFSKDANLERLAQKCNTQETVGMHSYIKERACHYVKAYFPMPYRDFMQRFSLERQALLYAIARQESRFIPGSVSRSFALGMMQIMPFLIDHIAKERGERIDYDEMFDPYTALVYADHHLDYLTTYLYHPLFVAYAYNGGIGFTKRLLTRKKLFQKGKYEPYMSMERVPSLEAREYGKKVLANYIIYLNLLGQPTRLLPFIEDLTDPYMTDRFRKKH
jgi:soluble lytic murein transglycosylase